MNTPSDMKNTRVGNGMNRAINTSDEPMITPVPPINTRAAWRPVLRPVSALVIAAQFAMLLQPVGAHAQSRAMAVPQVQAQDLVAGLRQDGHASATPSQSNEGSATQTRALGPDMRIEVRRELQALHSGAPDRTAAINQLKSRLAAMQAAAAGVRAEFSATRAELLRKNLPAQILARHDAAAAEFEQRSRKFMEVSTAWQASPSDAHLQALGQFFDQYPAAARPAPPATGKLPWGRLTPRQPAESKTSWFRNLHADQKVHLADAYTTVGGVQFSILPEPGQAPQDADVAATAEVTLSAAIRAKAAELGNNPVVITNWVSANVQWLPTWGAIQSADSTLNSLKGNAIDIASLHIALLRAAGIPARYQFGTIEISAAQAMNWVGGVKKPEAVLNLLAQGGIAARGISEGGAITRIRMEHAWVSAYVNWTPSRGARNGGADLSPPQHPHPNANLNAWVPLEGSYKQYNFTAGLNLAEVAPFSAPAVFDAAKQGATCTADSARQINTAALDAHYTQFKARAGQQLGNFAGQGSVGQVLGSAAVVRQDQTLLAGTLPYATVVLGGALAALPAALRWQVSLGLSTGPTDGNAQIISLSRSLGELEGQRLALSFTPETPADAQTLDALLRPASGGDPATGLPSRIPAYLVKLKAQLRLNGAVVGEGGSFTLGQTLTLRTGLQGLDSGGSSTSDATIAVGEAHAWAFQGQARGAVAPAEAAQKLAALKAQLNSPNVPAGAEQAREMLAGTAAAYQAAADARARLYQRVADAIEVRLPSVARASSRIDAEQAFGLTTHVRPAGIGIHVDRFGSAITAKNDATDVTAPGYSQQSLERASVLAHQLLDRIFGPAGSKAQSALSGVAAAAAQGQTLYRADTASLAAVLVAVDPNSNVRAQVQQAVANGQQALLPQNAVDLGGLPMDPLLLHNPQTGSAGYSVTSRNAPVTQLTAQRPGPAGWLGLADAQASKALIAPVLDAAIGQLNTAQALAADIDTTRWSVFASRDELIDGLYLARISEAASTQSACDWVISTVASQIGGGLPGSATVNRAPVIGSTPGATAQLARAYSYAVQASDADGDALSYALAGAPTGMTIDGAGLVHWPQPTLGQFAITVQVSDGKALTEQAWMLTVTDAGALQMEAVLTPAVANAGQTVSLAVNATAAAGAPLVRSATLDGTPLSLDGTGQAVFSAPGSGAHRVVATASDGQNTLSREIILTVRDASVTGTATAAITAPLPDAGVRGIVSVTGTAADPKFAYYKLLLRPVGSSGADWKEVGRSLSPVTNGNLGQIDTSLLNNGIYQLSLRVVDVNGAETAATQTIEVLGNLKLGQFRLSFADVRAEAPGFPLMLTRTYDSAKKDVAGDFGWGWSAASQDVTVRKNMTLGSAWVVETRPQTNELCIKPVGTRRISISLPDGGLYRFDAKNYQECRQFQVPDVQIVYTPVPGPAGGSAGRVNAAAQLRVIGSPLVLIQGGQIVDADTGTAYNPDTFELTTEEGFKYAIKEGVGILNVTDPYGNTVFYGSGGLQHSAQLFVSFERDGQGRITKATDPNGKSLVYTYNAQGELASVTDREGKVTQFSYATVAGGADARHLLASITDPRGVVVMSNQFDEYGRLAGVADANGQASKQEFDLANNRQTVTNKRGFKTVYTFDADGNITSVVNALGHTTTFTFDANGNELSTTNALGEKTERTFDASTGRQLTEKNPLGHTTATAYSSGGAAYQRLNPQATVDARGNTTTIAYPAGQVQSPGAVPERISEPLGRTTEIVQHIYNGNLVQLNIAGEVLNFGYDSKGRKTSETNGAGAQVLYGYDENGNETSRTVIRTVDGVQTRQVSTRKYDGESRLIEETDPLGARRTLAYNAIGKLASQTDAKGRVTTYTYDGNGRPTKTTYPDGTSESTAYDAEGNETARTDRQGRVTRMSYDALNRLTRTDYPDGSFETTEYDPADRVVATTDRRGKRATMEYDAAGRQTASVDASGVRTTSSYDENGNRIATSVAGRTTTFTYDALNRRTRTEWPDGSSHTSVYRPDNRKASETDARGVTTSYGYDGAGRLTSVQQSLSANATATTAYAYDETGAKTTQVDALGRTTTWALDAAGRITARKIQDGSQETSSYDPEGNRTAKKTFAGEQLSFQYDPENRLTGAVIPQGTGSNSAVPAASVLYRYSPAGNLTSVQEQGATTLNGLQAFSYDANDRLIGTSSPVGQISYTLDAQGNITARSVSSQGVSAGTTRMEYDDAGRIAKVIASDGKQTTYTYDAAGRAIRTERELNASGGQAQMLVTHIRYDGADRVIAIAQVKRLNGSETVVAGQALSRGAGGTISQIDTYRSGTYDSASGLFSAAPARTQAFEYDANARLTRENVTAAGATTDTRYEYDAVGNRTQKLVTTAAGTEITTYTYDAADRLTQESVSLPAGGSRVTSYGWDGNGNLASKAEPGKTTLYRFDPQNRLIDMRSGATQADAQAATPAISYAYDAAGNRVRKGGANATGYLIDSAGAYAQVAIETSASGTATAYVRGHQLIRQTKLNGTTQQDIFPMHGHLGTSLGAVDVDGNLIEQINADAFGVLEQSAGSEQTHLYTGEYWDQDAQLLYLRARWYDPRNGQFISADPFEGKQNDPRSLNRYSYAHNDPVRNTDPSGAMSLGEIGAGLNTQGVLANTARHYAFDYLQNRIFGEDDTLDGPESLYEMLLGTLMKSLAGAIGGPVIEFGGGAGGSGGKRVEGHHVIPEYMCGASKQVDIVNVQNTDHWKLHGQMINFDRTITYASKAYEVVFKKKKALTDLKSPINKLARTWKGRGAISAGLQAFYYENDWFFKGKGQKTRAPIGFVLGFEANEFTFKKNHKYHPVIPCRKGV